MSTTQAACCMGSRPCASSMAVSPQLDVRRAALPSPAFFLSRVLRRRPLFRGELERWQKIRSKRLSRTAAAQHSFRGDGRVTSMADPLRNYGELGNRVPFVEGSPQQRKRSQSFDDLESRVVVAAAAVQELRGPATNVSSTSSSSSIVVLREGEASDWRKWEEAFEDAKEKEALMTALQLIPRSESLVSFPCLSCSVSAFGARLSLCVLPSLLTTQSIVSSPSISTSSLFPIHARNRTRFTLFPTKFNHNPDSCPPNLPESQQ